MFNCADIFPHQLAHQAEAGWARGLQTNLLAANTHRSSSWTSGSGVFTPLGPAAYTHNVTIGSGGRLVMADIDIKPAKSAVEWGEWASQEADSWPDSPDQFHEIV